MPGTPEPFEIRVDDLTGREIAALLQGHLASAIENSPEGAVHALNLDGLRHPDITFWSAWQGDSLAGCCALRELTKTHGEVKSMRTAHCHLRQGVAARLLDHMVTVSRERGYQRISLETGNTDGFTAARALYAKFGFTQCPPFGNYGDDGFSICMTRTV
ncbi:MAG: putative acetyltransferase [Planctomycetota bacterium]|jgi:putative acetyltransferase